MQREEGKGEGDWSAVMGLEGRGENCNVNRVAKVRVIEKIKFQQRLARVWEVGRYVMGNDSGTRLE